MSSDVETRTGAGAVLAKVQNVNKKIVAVVLAVAMVFSLLFGVIHIKADTKLASAPQKDAEELITSKTVSPEPDENGNYHVTIEAYNNASELKYTPTDTMLVLEHSDEMATVLYTRDKTNLMTYTTFTPFNLKPTHNDLYVGDANPDNKYITIFGITIKLSSGIANFDKNNVYIKDPNNPNLYVYLSQTYQTYAEHDVYTGVWPFQTFDHTEIKYEYSLGDRVYNKYVYTIIDSQGNVYEATPTPERLSETIINSLTHIVGGVFNLDGGSIDSLDFYFVHGPGGENDTTPGQGVTPSFTISKASDFFRRDNDDGINSEIWSNHADGFYIKDDDGVFHFVRVEPITGNNRIQYYKYTVLATEDPTSAPLISPGGNPYIAYYGNPVYGADYAVFQGFKSFMDSGEVDSNNKPILVVDHDNSLEHISLYSGATQPVTRLLAMQEAAEDFILDVHHNVAETEQPVGNTRIGVVGFGSNWEAGSSWSEAQRKKLSTLIQPLIDVKEESNVYPMIKKIYQMEATGRRRIDVGMSLAQQELDNNRNPNPLATTNHEKIANIVAFTAGVPTSDNDYDTGKATDAIRIARQVENTFDQGYVYTIGLYENANADQTYGDWFYHSGWISGRGNERCYGNNGERWGGTIAAWTGNSDMDPTDAAATNRLLNFMSSNYKGTGVNQIGISRISGLSSIINKGYNITMNKPTPSNTGYYVAAQTGADLNDAFDTISESLIVPSSDLNSSTRLVDTVTPYFNIVGNTATWHTESYLGNDQWTDDNNDQSAQFQNKTVSITGFDYANNFINENPLNGKKIVVEFDVKPIDGFLGGYDVPTNGTSANGETSGIYDEYGTLVESFEIPTVDIDPELTYSVSDQDIYYSQEADLTQLFSKYSPNEDGIKNAFVEIEYAVYNSSDNTNAVFTYVIPAGETEGDYSLTGKQILDMYPQLSDTDTYTITCKLKTFDGNDLLTFDASPTDNDNEATVYVYKPVVTDNDRTVTYTEGQAGVNIVPSITWETTKNGDTVTKNDGTKPTVTYSIEDQTHLTGNEPTIVPKPDANNNETAYSVTEETNFEVVNFTIVANDFTTPIQTTITKYQMTSGDWIPADEFAYDNEGNPQPTAEQGTMATQAVVIVGEDGTETTVYIPIVEDFTEAVTRNHSDLVDSASNRFVKYVNETAPSKTENNTKGKFTVSTRGNFDLYLAKVFDGPYVVPEEVKFRITGSDDSSQEVTISNFDHLKSDDVKVSVQLNTGVTYTISEVFSTATTDESDYTTTFEGKWFDITLPDNTRMSDLSGGTTINDLDGTYQQDGETLLNETFQFRIESNNEPTFAYVEITNTDAKPEPAVTGISENHESVGSMIILAVLLVIAGGTTAYIVFRKKETTE